MSSTSLFPGRTRPSAVRRSVRSGPLLAVALAAAVPAAATAQLPVGDVSGHTAEVDEVFERFDSADSPGCAVAVSEEGRTVLSRAYGMADLELSVPNSTATIYEAGSVSKQFTAAAVVLLALDGELSLDDDVREHVPEVPDYGTPIALRQLMTHTSGLRDWGSVAGISGWGRSDRTHDHSHVVDIVSRQSDLNFAPGDRYSYSNSGYNLLAVVVERVSGAPFADFSKERIFKPLGMTSTEWRDDYRRIVPGRSAAYSETGNGDFAINRPIEHVHGNGGLLTTVGDLLIWNQALATGRIGGEAFVEAMHEPGRLNDGRAIHYAAGLQHGTAHGRSVVQHTGATSGYRAYLSRFPDAELSVALLCNVTSANPGALGGQVAGIFLGEAEEDEEEPAVAEGLELPATELEGLAGFYRSTLNNSLLRLVVEDGALRIDGGPALSALAETEFRVGSGERRFHFEPADGGGAAAGGGAAGAAAAGDAGGGDADDRSAIRADDRPAIRATVDGHYDQTYVPVEEFEPTAAELQEFAGTFHSEDAEATLTLRVEDGELVAHRRPDLELSVEPLYTDAFQIQGFGLARFVRDGEGRVVEMSHSRGRVYDIRFARVDD